MKNLIITKKFWNKNNFKNRGILVKKKINIKEIKKLNPTKIFFLHWSKIIPPYLYKNYECIQFHSTDLPYGKGGSPIQNLILRGFEITYLTAFKVNGKIDSGPIYFKKKMKLNGSASEIYERLEKKSLNMINIIIKKNLVPKKQKGKATYFMRRKKHQSEIKKENLKNLSGLYNFIRMLDADGYPNANLNIRNFKFEFYNAKKKKNYIISQVRMTHGNNNK